MIDTPSPRWLWRAAYLALGSVLAIWIGGMLVVSAGATDPPHFGPPAWKATTPQPTVLLPGSGQTWPISQFVPSPPFTLEVAARFDPTSDILARWGIILNSGTGKFFAISVGNGANYQLLPSDSRRIDFPHLYPAGQTNVLTLSVDSSGYGILRFNNEITWKGIYPLGERPIWLGLSGVGGRSGDSLLRWETIRLYTPTLNNSR